jgi:competence CoiA-like predicted nuclease
MQFALNQFKQRIKPAPKSIGFCPSCGSSLIPKCGQILCWHWSHKTLDCDPWYEPESEWHRNWKNLFPDDWQEVTIGNHRADVKTPRGVVEFQASSISSTEVQEREDFYGRMIWVVKADTFDLNRRLSPVADSFYYAALCKSIGRRPQLPQGNLFDLLGKDLHRQEQHQKEYQEAEVKIKLWENKARAIWNTSWLRDPMYKWRRPRPTWGFAKKKIYLDLGDELFGVTWMSPDCKMIKGTPFEKKKFIAKLLT